MPGVYQLLLHLPRAAQLKVGRLGTFLFPAGLYIYTGSALNGVEARLARHRRRRKKLHWHIDYFLQHAGLRSVGVLRTSRKVECTLNREVLQQPGAQVIAKGFGSSDCRCPAHLVFLGRLRQRNRIRYPPRAARGTWRDQRGCSS